MMDDSLSKNCAAVCRGSLLSAPEQKEKGKSALQSRSLQTSTKHTLNANMAVWTGSQEKKSN